jgi:hypothetical protein
MKLEDGEHKKNIVRKGHTWWNWLETLLFLPKASFNNLFA